MESRVVLPPDLHKFYEEIISDVLDIISDMRKSGDYDENTLESLEWHLSAPEEEN